MSHTKPISPEVISEAQALLAFAMRVPRHIADVFVEFSPNVAKVGVIAYSGGWRDGLQKDFDESVYADDEDALERIKAVRTTIEALVSGWTKTPPSNRETARAKSLRQAAQKLLAEAESLTPPPTPSPSA